jgi:Carboxypeptidase regulatory-like domain
MFRQGLVKLWAVIAVSLAFALPLLGQHATATVNGTITDSSGSLIPGASVVLTNVDTNVIARAKTNGSGYFAFVDVSPGQYAMTVTKANFKRVVLPVFHVVVDQTLTENETLSVGEENQTVTVNAAAEGVILERSSSELGNVIESKEIQNLPLNGRNFTQLLILSPGVNPVSTAQGSSISTTDAGISAIPGTAFYKPAFFGQQNRETFYLMDGIVNTDIRGAIYGFLPIIDAMQEFKVQSHMDSAEFGVVTGGVINMLSRSGTNQFHGSVWEFDRNNMFDARNTFTDFCSVGRCAPGTPATTPAAPGHYVQNEFGGALGGPILKDKMFFYGAYEGWRYSKPLLSQTLVPTSQELSGDFSSVAYSYYQHPIYNPYSTTCAGGKCTVQPFQCDATGAPIAPNGNGTQTGGTPCLKIPASLLNPVMQAYMKAYYLPPNAQAYEAAGYNFIESRPNIDNNNSYQVRVDIHNNDKNFGFGRISQMWVYDTSPVAGSINVNVSHYHAYNFGGGFTHIFGPSLILDVRGGAMLKPYQFSQAAAPGGYTAASNAGFTNLGQYGGMYINLASPYSTGNAGNEGTLYRGNPVVNGGGSLTWLKGDHTLKAGVDYIYQNRLQRNLYQQFTFSDSTTSNINASKTGNSAASALLGLPATFTAQNPDYSEDFFSMTLWSGYVQDSWKASPKLTVNYGVRYDYIPAIHMLNGRLANGLDIPAQQYVIQKPVAACTSTFANPCIPGGLASVPYNNHIVFANGAEQVGQPIKDNIGPRLGFAYQTAPKTVVNGGVGILYDTITARSQWVQNNIEGPTWPWTTGISSQQVNFSQNGVWAGGAGNPLTQITSLEGNFPNPVIASSPWLTTGGGYVSQPNFKDQRAVEYNLQVQQQLGPTTLFSLGYAGSKSTRLDYTGYANAAQHASPAGTPLTTIDTYKYMPWMTPGWHYSLDNGYANYNAMLVQFQKRFSNSWNTIASYTWSKSMDNSSGWFNAENGTGGGSVVQNFFNPRNAYGVSSYDITQYFTWSSIYTLPFGKGQRWEQRGFASYIVGGWTANYVFQARSGQPYNLNVGGDVANISGDNGSITGYSRPNVVGNPGQGSCGATPVGKRGPNGFCEYTPSAFAIPSGSFGDMAKMPYRQPYYNNLDFSLVKQTPLLENINLELRAESFNTYNAMIMGSPGSTIGNSSAGLATAITNTPRELQFGAKISF